ncbi:hypothetical protein DY124_07205 [Apilactobacillus micheneri]|nr:hypothetical protein DY124_07205 [Apilactobacillus micheneri]TPR47171.1 hypothetical protein DY125_07135 [Apilactobacillus micheneri]
MNSIKYILKYIGYILIIPSYIIFFLLFLSYLAYFCSQILTEGNVNAIFYKSFVSYGFIVPKDIYINFISSIIILSILISFIFVLSYMVNILKMNEQYTISKIIKLKFNISLAILISLNIISIIFKNYNGKVPSLIPNGNLIPFGLIIWILVILASKD